MIVDPNGRGEIAAGAGRGAWNFTKSCMTMQVAYVINPGLGGALTTYSLGKSIVTAAVAYSHPQKMLNSWNVLSKGNKAEIITELGLQAGLAAATALIVPRVSGPIEAPSLPTRSGGLSENALVVRGGLNTAESFTKGSGVTTDANGNLSGVSVNSANGATLGELSASLPHKQVGFTTVGNVQTAGGEVVPYPTEANPFHATISGLTAEQTSKLMNVVKNPNK